MTVQSLKVLVVAHRLELGGTQVNAIELAAQVRAQHGVQVVVAAAPGPALALIEERGLPYVPLPDADHHPGNARVRALARIGRQERPDLVHVWDWPQCFDAYPGLHLVQRRPMLCTVMTMVVPRFLPRHLATTFGTPALARQAQRARSGPVFLLEPPVDLPANDAAVVDADAMRRTWRLAAGEFAVVTVSRLENWRKLEGLERAVEVVDRLAARRPVKLVIVGDGAARPRLQARADAVNAGHGREVVLLTGPMVDPRPAYAASDVMLGMGGSALRTMAFGKPLIVLGERGFSRVFDERSSDQFVDEGYYGLGDGEPDDLEGQLERLLLDADERSRIAGLGLRVVRERYALTEAADRLAAWYGAVAASPVPLGRASVEAGRTASFVLAGRLPSRVRAVLRPRPQEKP